MSRVLRRRRTGSRDAHSDLAPGTRTSLPSKFEWVLSLELRMRSGALGDPGDFVASTILNFERNSENAVLGSDTSDLAYSALMDLPRDQRRVLVLAAVYRRTALEISKQEGIPLGIAKTQIRTGLCRVRTAVEGTGDAQDRRQTAVGSGARGDRAGARSRRTSWTESTP
jgi:DNA-directed RNA polymerase specialized sigma24 family protein